MTLTNYLADINVWVAIVVAEHVHHAAAMQWFDDPDTQSVAFCRVAQHGLLRLLANPQVMGGDALSAVPAWSVYDGLLRDRRVHFEHESANLELHWRHATRLNHTGPNFWTDAYLTAFATAKDLTLVTCDRAFTRQRQARVRLL